MNEVSDNTKAILLLTAPLIVSKKAEIPRILSLKDYNILARSLHVLGLQPHDLLGPDLETILPELPDSLGKTRLKDLLNRGFLLGQALTEWQRRSIWVVSRADPFYPKRLRSKLREHAPAVLYGCGDRALLEKGGLAVVGSRKISDEIKSYTENIGALAAEAKVPIVSGAARGIDSSAMGGALQNGGIVIGVMADGLGRAALAKANREALQDGKLVLISAYDPSAGFNVGHAMQRNKAIYALADAGLVVTSDFNKGGTWAGAIEQLERLHFAPVFVRNGADCGQGNAALMQHGGKMWPEPSNGQELVDAMARVFSEKSNEGGGKQLGLLVGDDMPVYSIAAEMEKKAPLKEVADPVNAADRLMDAVTTILLDLLREPKKLDELVEILKVSKTQASAWLKKLVENGKVEKLSKPVRYQVANGSDHFNLEIKNPIINEDKLE